MTQQHENSKYQTKNCITYWQIWHIVSEFSANLLSYKQVPKFNIARFSTKENKIVVLRAANSHTLFAKKT